jgi:DNA invertase Pin-like site-specific DNA recombinase
VKSVAIYTRVSTEEQKTDLQLLDLKDPAQQKKEKRLTSYLQMPNTENLILFWSGNLTALPGL